MKIWEHIKAKVNNKVNQVKAWAKEHPVAAKVIAGTTAVAAVGAAAAGAAYVVMRKKDEPDMTMYLPKIPEIETPEEDNESQTAVSPLEEEDREIWEADKEDWQKVLDVSKELSDLGDDYDGYHIYKLDGDVLVARCTDNGSAYHYAPEHYGDTSEPETQTTEAAE